VKKGSAFDEGGGSHCDAAIRVRVLRRQEAHTVLELVLRQKLMVVDVSRQRRQLRGREQSSAAVHDQPGCAARPGCTADEGARCIKLLTFD